jgi:hypothetical protein
MCQAKEKFLSQYTVDRHQKVVKYGETDVASLLSSLQVPNVSKPDCWGLVLKCYELRIRQHKMLNVNALRPLKHYSPRV